LTLLGQRRFAPRLCAALALSLPVAAASASSYPVSARLQLAPKDRQHCLVVPGDPPDCAVVELARTDFAETIARMFRQTQPADLELVLEVRSVEIAHLSGLELDLDVRVSVLAPGGRLIDQIDSSALVRLWTVEKGPVAAGLREATRRAALDFESNYRKSTKVADFLIGAKVAPASAVAAEWRSDRLITIAAGAGVAVGGDNSTDVAPLVQLSASWAWLFAQASYSRYSPAFTGANAANPFAADGSMSTSDLGFELGGVYRIVQSVEVKLAPGIHSLSGDATLQGASQSYSKAVPVLYGSITKAVLPVPGGLRLVAGFEARAYFFSSVALPAFSRGEVPAAKALLAVTIAVEFPWGNHKADHP
jgi:hypothetical protein